MTTPVPTTAAAHLAMVEALRKAREAMAVATFHHGPGASCQGCDRLKATIVDTERALEGWEKRPKLRDDEALIRELRFDLPDRDTTLRILDSVEAAMFGTGPRTGGAGD